MTTDVRSVMQDRPPFTLALAVCVAVVALVAWVRFGLLTDPVVPMPFALPLLVALWHRDRRLLWAMTAAFLGIMLLKSFWLLPIPADHPRASTWRFVAVVGTSTVATAAVIHLTIRWYEGLGARQAQLQAANAELETRNEELAAREEEITRQNEELQSQTEELEQQAEELRTQTEELQTTGAVLDRREETLAALLRLAGPVLSEQEVMTQVCSLVPELIGQNAVAAAVVERRGSALHVHAHCGFGPGGPEKKSWAYEHSLAALVLERNETGYLEDITLRPDIQIPQTAGSPRLRSILVTPLRLQGRPVGAIEVFAAAAWKWTAEQCRLLEWLAGQCSHMWEIIRLREERRQAEEELKALNESLEQRVAARTAEAEHRAAQLRVLAGEITQAEQRERRRLAQLLHDHLQQMLVAGKLKISLLQTRLPQPEARPMLGEVDELLSQAIAASRSLTVALSPPVLHERGLGAALHWLSRWMLDHHHLTVEVTAAVPAEPAADDVRVFLFQAARELLFNVVKHAGGGQARVTLEPAGAEQVRLTVADQGAGFDPAVLRHRGADASGLGLFSIEQRLELLGGTVEIASAPGRGTRVTLLAPKRLPEAPAGAPPAAATPAGASPRAAAGAAHAGRDGRRRIRLLLADDHKLLREGLVGLFHDQPDLEVVGEADNGQIAVELAHQCHPDVVLMDITMPVMNGIEATRRITAELPHVRVIGLSMHERDDMAAAMREAGAVSYAIKGAPADTLIAAIRACGPAAPAPAVACAAAPVHAQRSAAGGR